MSECVCVCNKIFKLAHRAEGLLVLMWRQIKRAENYQVDSELNVPQSNLTKPNLSWLALTA